MEIDEAAFAKAMSMPCGIGHGMFRKMLENYLAALPPAEPGRDRIAVWVPACALPKFLVLPRSLPTNEVAWDILMPKVEGPIATGIIRCNLPRPAEPVEISGTVEVVR